MCVEMHGEAQKQPCSWPACNNPGRASLSGRWLCQVHFYETATNRLADYRTQLNGKFASVIEEKEVLEFLSVLITQAPNLVASAEPLSQLQRDEFLELSLSAASFLGQIWRQPRQ